MTEIQEEKWAIDIDFLGLRLGSEGFEVSILTLYFKNEYRSLFSFGTWFGEVWTFDVLFYKFKD